eukprot:g9469.t1
MSKVAKLLGYRKHALGTVEVEVDKSDNWLELGAVGKDGKFCFSGKVDKVSYKKARGPLWEWPADPTWKDRQEGLIVRWSETNRPKAAELWKPGEGEGRMKRDKKQVNRLEVNNEDEGKRKKKQKEEKEQVVAKEKGQAKKKGEKGEVKKQAEQKEKASRKRKETGEPGKKKNVVKRLKLTEEEEKARQDEQNKIAEQAKQQENKLIETIQEKEKEEKEKQRLETERIERERAEAEQKAQKDKEEREKKEAEARKEALESINFDKPLEPTPVQTSALDSIIFDKLLAPPAGDGNPPVGDGRAEILVADTQKDKKPDPATLCNRYYCKKTSNIRTPLDYRTPGTVKGEQQSRATTALLESMVSKNMKNLALYPRKIAITREGEGVWVVGVQCKLSKQFLNKGGRYVTDLQKTILVSRRVVAADGTTFRQLQSCGQTVIDPIASELVGDVPDDEWNPEVPPLLVLMAPASQTPLENLPVIYDFAWVQEQPGNGGTYVNGRPKRQVKPKPEPEAEPVSSTPVQVTKPAKKTKTKAPKPKADPKPGNPGKPRKQPKVEHVEIIDQKEPAEKEKDTAIVNVLNTLSQTMLDVRTEIALMKQTQSTIPEQNKPNAKQPKDVKKDENSKVESVRFAQQAKQIAELQKTVEALQSKVQPTPAITLLDPDTQLTTLTTNSSASSFNNSNARQKLYQQLGNQRINSQNILQYHFMIEQQLLQEQNKLIRSQYLSSLF